MTTTLEIEPNQNIPRSFPVIDYSFRPTAKAPKTSGAPRSEKKLRAFRKLSSDFFGVETRLDYFAEVLFFVLITAISAWPIISAVVAVTRLVRGY